MPHTRLELCRFLAHEWGLEATFGPDGVGEHGKNGENDDGGAEGGGEGAEGADAMLRGRGVIARVAEEMMGFSAAGLLICV